MLEQWFTCNGIENYLAALVRARAGEAAPHAHRLLPKDLVHFVDGGPDRCRGANPCYRGTSYAQDHARTYGFRILPSSDRQPAAKFEEGITLARSCTSPPPRRLRANEGEASSSSRFVSDGPADPEIESDADKNLGRRHLVARSQREEEGRVSSSHAHERFEIHEYLTNSVKCATLHSDVDTHDRYRDHPRPAARRVRRARRIPLARRPGHPRGLAGDPRR